MSLIDLWLGELSFPGDISPACCLPHCFPHNHTTLYLGTVGKILFLWWHFLPSLLSKAKAVQVSVFILLNTRKKKCNWKGIGSTQEGFSNWKGQRSMERLDKYDSQFYCNYYSCLLVIYNPPILSRSKMACEEVYNRKLWNKSMKGS